MASSWALEFETYYIPQVWLPSDIEMECSYRHTLRISHKSIIENQYLRYDNICFVSGVSSGPLITIVNLCYESCIHVHVRDVNHYQCHHAIVGPWHSNVQL